jgi:PIN domain nuclease of toxin-antitoxin system
MMQRFLLDTCAALWAAAGELSQTALDALSDARRAGAPVYISPITAWEIGLLALKGRFRSQQSPQQWFERLTNTPDTALAELTAKVLIEASFLPGTLHSDPADRIIVATAREYGFTVMTRDSKLLDYAAQGYLSAMAC